MAKYGHYVTTTEDTTVDYDKQNSGSCSQSISTGNEYVTTKAVDGIISSKVATALLSQNTSKVVSFSGESDINYEYVIGNYVSHIESVSINSVQILPTEYTLVVLGITTKMKLNGLSYTLDSSDEISVKYK